ncbi:hypothetical protein [Streptomyces sp. NPDC058874]|uniref:hypothetical protein n=1 Tax=unclassified Streptomyces TaxID=2593676 RepID=UPI0036C3704A
MIVGEGALDAGRLHRRLRPSQPFSDRGDKDGGFEADGELVEAGRGRPVPFEAVDAALDRMAFAVVDRVEAWRPASAGAELSTVARLVGLVRDGAADPVAAQVGAVLAGALALSGPHPIGADAWPARPDVGHADLLQHGFELRRVAALPGRDRDRHGLLALLNRQVQLGGEPAA